ncbi:MAG: ABC transporter substrate-binding protein [Ilumatobacter sp.]|nr:ABC transporter substrate-binding protein [Ilumatobacter sp.]
MHSRPPQRRRLGIVLAVAAALTAACGSDSPDGAASADAAAAVPADAPQRIVSLSPTHTEMLFAIGAGEQLVAVDEFSDYPAEALELPNELSGFEPNVEAIAAYEPDLVVIGGDFTGLGDQLATIDIDSWDGPAAVTIEDTYKQLEQLGAVTGHEEDAAAIVSDMKTQIAEIVADAPETDRPLTFYHELDDTLYSADSTTFIGDVYGMLGLQNIADRIEGDHFGFPQLNAEFLVSADPDLIFLADTKCCGVTAETVAGRPGWDTIAAVRNGHVIPMDDDVASRWGPRIVDYLAAVAAAVGQAAATAT